MKIKLVNPSIVKWYKLRKHLKEILTSKELTTGKWTKKCEEEIKRIHDCKYCVLTGSGTAAFMLLLSATNEAYNHNRVLMQDFTWRSTKDIAKIMNKNLELVDVDKDTWLAEEPKDKDCLFIPNMTFGNVKTYKHKKTLYDSAHCFGNAVCNGRGYGEILSFSPAKMSTAGEGGAIITNNKKIYLNAYKNRRYHGRISEMNACLLYYNMKDIIKNRAKKVSAYMYYTTNLPHGFKQQHPVHLTPNELVVMHKDANKMRKRLSSIVDIRQRYAPTNKKNTISQMLYDNGIVLPSEHIDEIIKILK